ncbi:modification methylase [Streptomyces viridosporus ATCC 14672]|uniref:Modification methylase n=1 Tax=Streptomyces viridosporus (strain ATCC 14672 / DSM 40746 / JCM 4963 / KCTC 9882 / NRRL B-12104 / FH 1290) TaxID=566461 RepID=D5ZSU2_STRV1|nr:modification methylase [Streptomyces viridosporus ATCC 14672]
MADPDLLAELDGTVDLVTANPPYVPERLVIPAEWSVHQPAQAIYSGWDGLTVPRAVVATAARLLKDGGVLAMEHYDAIVDEIVELVRSAGFESVTSHVDHDGFPRYVIARRAAR